MLIIAIVAAALAASSSLMQSGSTARRPAHRHDRIPQLGHHRTCAPWFAGIGHRRSGRLAFFISRRPEHLERGSDGAWFSQPALVPFIPVVILVLAEFAAGAPSTRNNPMQLSNAGAADITLHEGVILKYYLDAVKVPTIGIGFTWGSMAFRKWWLQIARADIWPGRDHDASGMHRLPSHGHRR